MRRLLYPLVLRGGGVLSARGGLVFLLGEHVCHIGSTLEQKAWASVCLLLLGSVFKFVKYGIGLDVHTLREFGALGSGQ